MAEMTKEREAFDRFALSNGASIDRTDGGEYRSAPTEATWTGWQARAALSAAPQADPMSDERKALAELVRLNDLKRAHAQAQYKTFALYGEAQDKALAECDLIATELAKMRPAWERAIALLAVPQNQPQTEQPESVHSTSAVEGAKTALPQEQLVWLAELPVLRVMANTASIVMGNLPEQPGYNGSRLIIDDADAEEVVAAIDATVSALDTAAAYIQAAGAQEQDKKDAPSRAPGYVLVPIEPTGAMWSVSRSKFIEWANKYEDAETSERASIWADVAGADIYRAMLEAAQCASLQEQPAPAGVQPSEGGQAK